MKNILLLLLFTSAFGAFCQSNKLSGIYIEYKETLLNSEDGSKYTYNQKPFEPKLQFEFNDQNTNVIVYNGKNKSEQTFATSDDTLMLNQTFGKGEYARVIQTKYLITENKKELVLCELKNNLDKDYYLKKYYLKKSNAINQEYINIQNYDIYTMVEEMPSYPGDKDALKNFIAEEVKKLNYSGNEKVFIKLTINPEGKIVNADILNNPKTHYVEGAMKITRKLSNFTPGKQNGKPVYVYFNFPVKFIE